MVHRVRNQCGVKICTLKTPDLDGHQKERVSDDPGPSGDVRADVNQPKVRSDRDDEKDQRNDPGDEFWGVRPFGHELDTPCGVAAHTTFGGHGVGQLTAGSAALCGMEMSLQGTSRER
jgi:hypothetical protein